jgi:2,3-bisphosphoglycerate-independent phosphoglycerate mutase
MKKPICLIIRDGWGKAPPADNNAIYQAKTAFADMMESKYPTTMLGASGLNVGLPEGTMGNSEVGHLNIGAGRIVFQSLTRINMACNDGSMAQNPVLLKAIEDVKVNGSRMHLIGLVQDAGVHAMTEHALAILKACKQHGVDEVAFHAITDGRDTPPKSALDHLAVLQQGMDALGVGRVVSVLGRYYAMDRDNRWDRTKLAYDAVIKGQGRDVASWQEAIEEAYAAGETDEFIKPRLIDYNGIGDNDVVLFFNYRFDRTRQLTRAIVEPGFNAFPVVSHKARLVAMTHYYDNGNFDELFPELEISKNLGEVICEQGLRQLRCAETEKFAHVTFFFNSLRNEPYDCEDRILVDSPKVATYDLKPEMSAFEVRDKLVEAINKGIYDVIICNFANCDMVGHTGVREAVIRAVETVEICVRDVVEAVLAHNGVALVTADHGNAEQITLDDGSPMTAHTTFDVPLSIVGAGDVKLRGDGNLGDIAPTILYLMGIKQPEEMTGRSLIIT